MTGRGLRGERGEQADKIITAARRSFATRGYAATSLRSVAQDADVDPGLVHYYFRTETGLLEAVMQPPRRSAQPWPPPSSPYTSADARSCRTPFLQAQGRRIPVTAGRRRTTLVITESGRVLTRPLRPPR
ncbi:helix-turn-helix domain-containing protein [Streptomyces sp. NPDC019890]|uniref:helix-turn-helix domain-containing protein n=1 Tax=Streptomyces sp. NPDC019890 TaxID=3365064 RepID=UPI00384B5354